MLQRSFMQRKCQCAIFFRSLSGWTRGSGSKTRNPYFTLPEDKNVECVRIELKDLRELPRK
mgnify:CR=1 FL=1